MGNIGGHALLTTWSNVSVGPEFTLVIVPHEFDCLFGFVDEGNVNSSLSVDGSEGASEMRSWAHHHASSHSSFGWWFVSTMFVIEAFVGKDWSLHTSDDSLPLVWLSNLTDFVFGVEQFTTEKYKRNGGLRHVLGGSIN